MKNSNKSSFLTIVLLLLPLLCLISYFLLCLSENNGLEYLQWGELTITPQGENFALTAEEGTISAMLLDVVGTEWTGFMASIIRLMQNLNTSIGLPLTGLTLSSFLYLCYATMLLLAQMLVDVVTLVPRLCGRWLAKESDKS